MSDGAAKMTVSRAFLVVVTLGVLATLTGLAYASPPDASWIPGIYDNADFDDVVVLVTLASGLVGPVDLAGFHVISPPTATPALPPEKAPFSVCAATLHARAPPPA